MERDKNPKIVDILFARIGVEFMSKFDAHGNIFMSNHWREKEEDEQSHHWYFGCSARDCTRYATNSFLEVVNVAQKLENALQPVYTLKGT